MILLFHNFLHFAKLLNKKYGTHTESRILHLHKIFYSATKAEVDVNELMRCYHRYMSFAVQQPPTYKQFVANMEEKMVDPDFLGDTQLLLRPDEPFDPIEGYKAVKERLIENMQ